MDLNECYHPDDHKTCMRRCGATGTWRPRALGVRVVADPAIRDAPGESISTPSASLSSEPVSPSISAGGMPASAPAPAAAPAGEDHTEEKVIGDAFVQV